MTTMAAPPEAAPPEVAPFEVGDTITALYLTTAGTVENTTAVVRELHRPRRSGRWQVVIDAPDDLAPHHRDPGREHFYTVPSLDLAHPACGYPDCGVRLDRLSPLTWVDGANNKASAVPGWHEHSPRTEYVAGSQMAVPADRRPR